MKRSPFSARVANGRQMGRLGLVSLAVFFLATSGAAYGGASGISLLSESHHVSGVAGESLLSFPWGPTGNVVTYDQTSATPLDVSAACPPASGFFPGYAHSAAGDFSVLAESFYWDSFASAASEYRFTPDGSSLCVRVFGWTENYAPTETIVRYTLSNSTLGVALDEFEAMGVGFDDPLGFDWQRCYAVSPDNEYLLTLSANTTGSDFLRTTGISADLTCVPSPSALLLGAFGAGLTAWRRRRESREA